MPPSASSAYRLFVEGRDDNHDSPEALEFVAWFKRLFEA